MRVLFISRATLFNVRGGDTVQMENTARALRSLGIEVVIELCNNKHIDYSIYELIHFFNIIRPADILYHIYKSKLPFVVSPIYVEYDAAAKDAKSGWAQSLLALLGKHFREYVKTIARAVKNKERIMSLRYLFLGHRRSIRGILSRCSYLLPNSQSEYSRLKRDFNNAGAYRIVPNAIDTTLFHIASDECLEKEENTVLCVARFEPRKNQLRVIQALNGTPYKVLFAGDTAPNHSAYYQACRAAAAEHISFIEHVGQEKIAALYRRHKVHILASWFETTGLSSLEAIACGCNVVISKNGDTEEYFGTHAFYCDPGNTASIRAAVDRAMAARTNREFMEEINAHYNWEVTARETYNVYQKVIRA